MEEVIIFAGLFAFVMVIGFVGGYAFRGFIHKEIEKAQAEYTKLHDRAVTDLKEVVNTIKAKI